MFDFLYIQVTVITAATSSYCQGLLLYSCQKIGIWWIFDWFKKESNLIAFLELVVKFHLIFHYNELTNVFVEPDCLIATFSRVSVGNLMISFKLTLWRCIFLKTVFGKKYLSLLRFKPFVKLGIQYWRSHILQ